VPKKLRTSRKVQSFGIHMSAQVVSPPNMPPHNRHPTLPMRMRESDQKGKG
jgi:hypothetical protein